MLLVLLNRDPVSPSGSLAGPLAVLSAASICTFLPQTPRGRRGSAAPLVTRDPCLEGRNLLQILPRPVPLRGPRATETGPDGGDRRPLILSWHHLPRRAHTGDGGVGGGGRRSRRRQLVLGHFSSSVYFPALNCVIARGSPRMTARAKATKWSWPPLHRAEGR